MEKWLEENECPNLSLSPSRPPHTNRYSVESRYSYAYQLDIDTIEDMADDTLMKLKVPAIALPSYVKDAFRKVAKNDALALKQLLRKHENLLFCVNQGGMTLLEVAKERGHNDCIQLLTQRKEENQYNESIFLDEEASCEEDIDSLTCWLKQNNLDIELRKALSEIAADVTDLAEMTDADVDTLFASNYDLKVRNEQLFRRALQSIGALRILPTTPQQHTTLSKDPLQDDVSPISSFQWPPVYDSSSYRKPNHRIHETQHDFLNFLGCSVFLCCGRQ